MVKSRATLRSIAEALNLSPGTVSRSLRGHPDIQQETRVRIMAAAQSLGYVPRSYKFSQQQAKKSKSIHIDVLIGNLCGRDKGFTDASYVGYHCLAGLSQAASKFGFTTGVTFLDATTLSQVEANRENLPLCVQGGQTQGIVLIYPFPEPFVAQISRRIPTVSFEQVYPGTAVDTVGPTHALDAMRAVQLLAEKGHTKIGYIADDEATGNLLTQSFRHSGYLAGLRRMNLNCDLNHIIGLPYRAYTKAELPEIVKKKWFEGVKAWVCSIDRHAYLLWKEMPRLGIEVPQDLSLAGIGGTTPMYDLPQLTTFRLPYEDLAVAALNRIERRIRQPEADMTYTEYSSKFIAGCSVSSPVVQ